MRLYLDTLHRTRLRSINEAERNARQVDFWNVTGLIDGSVEQRGISRCQTASGRTAQYKPLDRAHARGDDVIPPPFPISRVPVPVGHAPVRARGMKNLFPRKNESTAIRRMELREAISRLVAAIGDANTGRLQAGRMRRAISHLEHHHVATITAHA